MRENRYPNEKFAGGLSVTNSPANAISSRMDLDVNNRMPNGGIDSKIINNCMWKKKQVQAISGPTHLDQAAFDWDEFSSNFGGWPHFGLP